jgi:hypothetical protein
LCIVIEATSEMPDWTGLPIQSSTIPKSGGEEVPGGGDTAWWRRATAIVRSNLAARDAQQLLRAAIREVDPAVPIELKTLEARVDTFRTKPRFETVLLLMFGLTGLALAGIGPYGLSSFLVEERAREIAVRIALGVRPARSPDGLPPKEFDGRP